MAHFAAARPGRNGQNLVSTLWRAAGARSLWGAAAERELSESCSSCSAGQDRVSSRKLALAATSAVVGAAALASWQFGMASGPGYSEAAERVALIPTEWRKFKLQHTEKISHDTKLYRFEIDPDEKLGLNVASCVITRAPIGAVKEGKPGYVIRPYTPVSSTDTRGHFDLVVKSYEQGRMSRHIASLKKGDTLEVKGPITKLPYVPNMKKQIGMIAGGTGITPMKQIIDEILKNPEDNTQLFLVYGNKSPEDILLKEELDFLAASHPNFKVFYVVDNPNKPWVGGKGFINLGNIRKGLPPPSPDNLILVCGPPGMMAHISGDKGPGQSQGELTGLLKEAGYSENQVYKF